MACRAEMDEAWMDQEDDLDSIFRRLETSPFRSRFRLDARDRTYFDEKGRDVVLEHARAFISERLAPRHPKNDGQQTPMRGHPVFVAQHATATCCRGCLEKWHGIATGQPLSQTQQDFAVRLIAHWLDGQIRLPRPSAPAASRKAPKESTKASCRAGPGRKPRRRRGNPDQLDLFGAMSNPSDKG